MPFSPLAVALLALIGILHGASGQSIYPSTTAFPPIPIMGCPMLNIASSVSSSLTITDSYTITAMTNLRVRVVTTHATSNFLRIWITHAGVTVLLWDPTCFVNSAVPMDVTFQNGAAQFQTVPSGGTCSNPATGTYAPIGPTTLSAFDTQSIAGAWTLNVCDQGDTSTGGAVTSWQIIAVPPTPPPGTPSTPGSLAPPGSPTGGVAGDPHVRGLDGQVFDFDGSVGRVYNLFSDAMAQVNALLGVIPTSRYHHLPGHWITDIGIVTQCAAIAVAAGRPIDSIQPSILVSSRPGQQQQQCSNFTSIAASVTDLHSAATGRVLRWSEDDPESGESVPITLEFERFSRGRQASEFNLPASERLIERLMLTIDKRVQVAVFLVEIGYSEVKRKWLIPTPRRYLDLSATMLDAARKPHGILGRTAHSTWTEMLAAQSSQAKRNEQGWQEEYREPDDNLFGSDNRYSRLGRATS